MADYHAVLQRTLSGFDNPKPELRSKLYDRARTTITRQLENRKPPVTGAALSAEMDKLEYAIFEIERSYDPAYPEPVLQSAIVPEAAPEAAPEIAPAPEPVPEAAPQPQTDPQPMPAEPVAAVPEVPAEPVPAPPPAAPPADPSFAETLATTPPIEEPAPAPAATSPTAPSPLSPPPMPATPEIAEADMAAAVAADAGGAVQPAAPAPDFEPLSPPPPSAAPPQDVQTTNDDAVDQWAQEFLAHQPGAEQTAYPAPPQAYAPPPAPPQPSQHVDPVNGQLPLPDELQQPQAFDPQPPVAAAAAPPSPSPSPSPPPAAPAEQNWQSQENFAPYQPPAAAVPPPPIPSLDGQVDESLEIPPAPGFGNGATKRRKKRGIFKWFLVLLLLALLAAGGAYGWMNKETLLEQIGMSHLLDDPTRPKPVKTITISPQPETPDEPLPASKQESRLTGNGEEVNVSNDQPATVPTLQPQVENPAAPSTTSGDGTVPVAQSAILYEEGATPAQNTVDAGRVVWSVIEEEPASGQPAEPAISARVEIPDRNVVLIMKIKRNADKALPASHLIELVFAVPDGFSGGAIGQVSRFVLKQSEQGRGEGLVGVPARIADGIFLIALNNLEQAKAKNESLLISRDWIDIPLQYRTGRRALITIEKGLPGQKIFDEVFEAWAQL